MAQGLQDGGAGGTGLARGQTDFFLCDILDAIPKDDVATMEHPVFSLATRPDRRILRYAHNETEITVTPSVRGLATIHDKDILIYCISQLIAAINDGQTPSKTLRMKAYDFLKATNRVTDGRGYDALRSALIRLQGTQIETNIVTGETEQLDIFSIIDRARIVRQTRDGRMQEIEVHLDRARDDDLALGMREHPPEAGLEIQNARGSLELPEHGAKNATWLRH